MNNNIFGENLRQLREENGLTQQALADMVMISHQSISKWELGITYPQVIWVYRIADVLRVNPERLIAHDQVRQIRELRQ